MIKKILKFVLFLALGAALGILGTRYHYRGTEVFAVRVQGAKDRYKFINPLLLIDNADTRQFGEYKVIKDDLSTKIEEDISQGLAEKVSVYFRWKDHWVGIGENETYSPASLLKVPVMIAFFKQAESDPSILKRKITYSIDGPTPAGSEPSHLIANHVYTVEQLIIAMIEDSDNVAKDLLLQLVDKHSLDEAFTDLGIQISGDSEQPYAISAKTYSLFFRILRNATFLNREYSEKALEILSRTNFKEGLVSGPPEGTLISHKYGVYNLPTGGTELHDCGIIYTDPSPYVLCVMTRGKNIAGLEKTIKDISALIFNKIKA